MKTEFSIGKKLQRQKGVVKENELLRATKIKKLWTTMINHILKDTVDKKKNPNKNDRMQHLQVVSISYKNSLFKQFRKDIFKCLHKNAGIS